MVTSVNAAPVPASSFVLSASSITRLSPPSYSTSLLAKPIKFSSSNRIGSDRLLQLDFLAKSSTKDVDSEKASLPSGADSKSKSDDAIDKTISILIYGGGVFLALWLSSTIVRSVNSVPLLPKFLEIFGLAYTAWFAYRYLLFKENRKELAADIKELTSKITGTDNE